MTFINTLNRIAKKIFAKGDIKDIILFGSIRKGKKNPKDIDILIIFTEHINKKIEQELKQEINLSTTDINSLTVKELEETSFIAKEGIYLEGLSLISKKAINETMGFNSVAFIKYTLTMTGSKRVRFYYALQGRGTEKGFLNTLNAKRYAESVIVCDYNVLEEIKLFFDHLKLEYIIIPALIPNTLRHIL